MLSSSKYSKFLFNSLQKSPLPLKPSYFFLFPQKFFNVGIGYPPKPEEKGLKMYFQYTKEVNKIEVMAREGETLLEVAHNNKVELEGACEQSLACSTCHVILEPQIYDTLEDPVEEEEDLLDLAYGLTHTSRLGCQVKVTKEMEGMVIKLPSATRNFYVDKQKK